MNAISAMNKNNVLKKEGYTLILSGLPGSPTLSSSEPSLLYNQLVEYLELEERFEPRGLHKLRSFQQRCYNLKDGIPNYYFIEGTMTGVPYRLGVELRKALLLSK